MTTPTSLSRCSQNWRKVSCGQPGRTGNGSSLDALIWNIPVHEIKPIIGETESPISPNGPLQRQDQRLWKMSVVKAKLSMISCAFYLCLHMYMYHSIWQKAQSGIVLTYERIRSESLLGPRVCPSLLGSARKSGSCGWNSQQINLFTTHFYGSKIIWQANAHF